MITELKRNLNIIYGETKNVLIPENIVEEVTILGVTGTFKSHREYIELDYIESTGTQYIDTGVIGDSKKRIQLDCSTTGTPSGNAFGAWSQNNCLMAEYYLNQVVVYYNTTNNNPNYSPYEANTRYKYDISNSLINVTRGDGKVLINKSQSGSFSTGITMYMFARHVSRDDSNEPSSFSPIKFYSCQIWNGNTLVRDFIPVTRTSDSKVCIYDKVEKKFSFMSA